MVVDNPVAKAVGAFERLKPRSVVVNRRLTGQVAKAVGAFERLKLTRKKSRPLANARSGKGSWRV